MNMFLPARSLTSLIVVFICFTTFASGASLPADEVESLKQIAKTLGKTDWNFSADPCSGQWGWVTQNPVLKGFENAVTCNCSFSNNTVCHIVGIVLKSQDLQGIPPPELGRLPFLQELDLTRNYLNGTIPPEWGSTQLVNISLNGNRLTGPIPKELGNISTLANLTLQYNHLSGTIPPELGNLSRIHKIHLSSNNLTGELPQTLAKLTTLKDFRISDNHFTGKIPNFIQNWINLERLMIQGSGLDGPIPSGIALLTNLTDLRISDLNGTEATFPPLNNIKNLKTLILRSCNIVGQLPAYLGDGTFKNFQTFDLSFNKLSGEIPNSFASLSKTEFIYFTGNLLTGAVPDWILNAANRVDLSFNNFTFGKSGPPGCQHRTINLFGSSSEGNASGIFSCTPGFRCPQKLSNSFYINCGGREASANGTIYEEDIDQAGSTNFYNSRTNWAFSSTGHFLDNNLPTDSYIGTNIYKLPMNNGELYMDARLSPISLTYYGYCLMNGSYTVRLHFAEIMFTDGKTYRSLGRRVFDVYIQGKLVWKDFNIEDEAGGVGREVIKNSTAVVTNNSLEIRLYWAGKGTDGIPDRGVYGPLISAISVDPDFMPPSKNGNSISVGAVVGIVIVVASAIFLVVGILWWKGCIGRRNTMDHEKL